jgi:hypothetical protein
MLSFLMSLPKLPKRPNASDDMSFKVSSSWVEGGAGDVASGGKVQVSLDDDEIRGPESWWCRRRGLGGRTGG